MLGNARQDAFVSRSIIAIVATLRADGSPATSMVSFARKDDHLFFSTTLGRLKGRTLARDKRLTLTIINPREPWSFVSVEGSAVIHLDNPLELRQLILDAADGLDHAWSREESEAMIVAGGRAIFEVVPARVSGVVFRT